MNKINTITLSTLLLLSLVPIYKIYQHKSYADTNGCVKGQEYYHGKCTQCNDYQYSQKINKQWICKDCPDSGYACDGINKFSCIKGYQALNAECEKCQDSYYGVKQNRVWTCEECPDEGYQCDGVNKKKCQRGYEGENGVCYKCPYDGKPEYDRMKNIWRCSYD